jgi:hypothetical protein
MAIVLPNAPEHIGDVLDLFPDVRERGTLMS